ncbi:hypothetical protein ANCDUO_04387 [Ancylostoma duodenale]|uniref:SLC12A transporter C-terminal domain-containing protein n=1 Tax=Ancylostoma duodenale TaxID=51022 RepID=A0A0C2H147_9BILA|nr:hypothetical protein ANCDUO_04387 [Ancylostoma duodenale]
MITAARTAQDIARCPGLVHGLDKLTHGYGKENNPRKAYVVISIAAVIISMLGEFNNRRQNRRRWYLDARACDCDFKPSGRIYMMTDKVDRQMSEWLTKRNISAYPAIIASEDQAEGAATLLQTTGVGKLRPNILMVGFRTKWEQDGVNNMDNINTFYEIIM